MQTMTGARPPRRHVTTADANGLARICDDGTNLVVWPRPTPPWLPSISLDGVPECETRACLDSITASIDALVEPLRDLTQMGALVDDVRALAHEIFRATRATHVDARLSVTRSDGCRKFHTDRRHARLLCTYAGPGTEWVPDRCVDRDALCRDDVDIARVNEAIVRDPRAVRAVPPGWVALLKGELWPGNAGRGLVHRSPPIEALGAARLVLALDAHV